MHCRLGNAPGAEATEPGNYAILFVCTTAGHSQKPAWFFHHRAVTVEVEQGQKFIATFTL
jgi:hypothetical protein